ncbi:glycoside hydrolase family 3 N-terminal domain-containing protein [Terracoccus luteus]|uniref:glycoside hydrolase family 3 N-terminal domain-containing protein n=1 Tax=Terracoccus luteus TaxID=53356 RepID=UPI001FE39DE8|nr:glycoside hydrolase family 3 N-terminal domain-containing protein [Terracoccus luteus]
MTHHCTPSPRPLVTALAVAALAALGACSGGSTPTAPGASAVPTGPAGSSPATAVPTRSATSTTDAPSSPSGSTSPSSPSSPSSSTGAATVTGTTSSAGGAPAPTTTASTSCAERVVDGLSATQQAGQLLMVGLDSGASRTSLDALVQQRHLGGVILLGGWTSGAARVEATTSHLESLAGESTGGLGLLLAADQEGGQVQQLRGSGFDRMPSALTQGTWSADRLTSEATGWARQLKAAGINVNLAPVADTVPTGIGTKNGPIGRYGRQYSSDPAQVGESVGAFVAGMRAGGVASTVKHFPGIGRITGNTDTTASGITDRTTSATDPYLEPFADGIRDGADLVMVGSAVYPRIDGSTNAVFSRAVVTGVLRDRLGWQGVTITDDVGAAAAVADVPVAQRAVRFVEAGGDIVLTAVPSTVGPMHEALKAEMSKDAGFAAQVRAAAVRVVALKARLGLASCG